VNRTQALARLTDSDPTANSPQSSHDFAQGFARITGSPATVDVSTSTSDTDRVPLSADHRTGRRVRRRTATVAAAALLVIVVIGAFALARRDRPPSPAGTETGSALQAGPGDVLAYAVTLQGVELRVPAQDQHPELTAAEAVAICRAQAVDCGRVGRPPLTVALASATSSAPAVVHTDGSTSPINDNRLVWAITWPSDCVDLGGGVFSNSAPAPSVTRSCSNLVLIDARSGDVTKDVNGPTSYPIDPSRGKPTTTTSQ
jgi:hypothetical protein